MDLDKGLSRAVRHFWRVRTRQYKSQGSATGRRDAGNRSAVTGGKQLDGFIDLLRRLLAESGLPKSSIHKRRTTLPGYFRPTKDWDLVVVAEDELVASIEFKSHVGPSFGNNFNNRVEEALGNAADLQTAFREGKFKPSARPWLGWIMLLEDSPRSRRPVRASEPHFEVFEEFREASYVRRYELFCERLVRERLYDASCLLLSSEKEGLKGRYDEPNPELNFEIFATSLSAHAMATARRIGK